MFTIEQTVTMASSLKGALLGCATGDALGFVVEGFSEAVCHDYVNQIVLPQIIPINKRLPQFTFGQYSDDTQLSREFLIAVKQSEGLSSHNKQPHHDMVAAIYAQRIAALFQPNAYLIVGYGGQTESGALAIRQGVSHRHSGSSGISGSSGNGNGSAMRSAIIGVATDCWKIEEVVSLTRTLSAITHASPRTMDGAVIIALAARQAVRSNDWNTLELLTLLKDHVEEPVWLLALDLLSELAQNASYAEARRKIMEFAASVGDSSWPTGIGHGVIQTVMWSLYSVHRYPDDWRMAVALAIRVGGDVDSTAAIVGAIVGARLCESNIPTIWRDELHDRDLWTTNELAELCEEVAKLI